MYRVEDKYLCSEQDFSIIQSKCKAVMRQDYNSKTSKGYKVSSVYFDDIRDTHLLDSLNGSQVRKKYRIRIYDGSFETIKLEVKYKYDNRVFKKSQNISYGSMVNFMRGKCIGGETGDIDDPITLFNLAISKDLLRPKVIVEYDRVAYTFPAGNVRVTFDKNVRSSTDFRSFLKDDDCRFRGVPGLDRVLEVKYDEFIPGFIMRLLESGNMHQIEYSKYKICREYVEDRLCQHLM